jgi:hypothetical protein
MDKLEISKKIDTQVTQIFSNSQLQGFEKAVKLADGVNMLRELLSDDYMTNIMKLQGSKIGFRTDKDKKQDGSKGDGYPVDIVKDCLIEATLIGLEPVGNHWNILAGNMYVTKEGAEYLLNKEGVKHILRFGSPKIDQQQKVARLDVEVEWTHEGQKNKEIVPISTKWNAYTTEDAIQGKATRKARVWLYNRIHNTQISDGDITDVAYQEVHEIINYDSVEGLFHEHIEKLTEAEIKHAKMILEGKREKDYKRLYDFLNGEELKKR